MATVNKELARATTPLGPLFGRGWMSEFDRLFNRPFPVPTREEFEFAWVPEMEVFEKNDRLTVRLDVPGLKKEELTVQVTGNVLVVGGERKHEAEEEKNHWYRRERTYGKFYRTVPLPDGVNLREVEATFANGVLEVTLPLHAAETPAHKVEVKVPGEKAATAA